MKYKNWVPVTDENRSFVEDQQSVGLMRTTYSQDDDILMEYAKFTPLGYRLVKRRFVEEQTKVRKFLYHYLNHLNSDLSESLFVGNLRN